MASTVLHIVTYKGSVERLQAESLLSEPQTLPESKNSSGKVRVLLVTVGLEAGGTEGQLLELAYRLDPDRFVVTVCALKGEGTIAGEMRRRGIKVVTLNGIGKMDPRVFLRFFSLVRAELPDVIHSFLPLANYVGMIVGNILRIPVLIASYRDIEPGRAGITVWADRLVVRLAQATTCCSDAVRCFAIKRFGGETTKYVTIHNGIDVERFHRASPMTKSGLGLREGIATIGTVCRLEEPKKGLATLLKALALLTQRDNTPPFQLLLVGEGPSSEALRQLSEELSLCKIVVFSGLRRDVEQILPLLDLFVLPSLYEGFGIALVEAMAAGCPVVATAVGGIPEIIASTHTGILVPAGDPTLLAQALADLLCNQVKSQSLGKAGQEWACAQFSVSTMVRNHERLYEQLMQTVLSGNVQIEKNTVRV